MASQTIQVFGFSAECFVFAIIGVSFMHYVEEKFPWSWKFVLAEFFIIIGGRSLAIYLSYYMFSCCKGDPKNYLSFKEVSFCSYAAFIRGAIAFGLVVNVDEKLFQGADDEESKKPVIETSILLLVIFTTCIIGSLTNLVKSLLMPPTERIEVEDADAK